jgi:hypothetical protein
MQPDLVVVFEVSFEKVVELTLLEHDDSIQAFAPDGSDQPLRVRILPRRLQGDQFLLDTHTVDPAHEG